MPTASAHAADAASPARSGGGRHTASRIEGPSIAALSTSLPPETGTSEPISPDRLTELRVMRLVLLNSRRKAALILDCKAASICEAQLRDVNFQILKEARHE